MSIEIKAWKCEKCDKYYLNQAAADDCCKEKPEKKYTCRVCGCDTDEFRLICDICLTQERFAKAKKVKYSEYKVGYLWDEDQDAYFADKDALEEKYLEDAEDSEDKLIPIFPTWCYGCTETIFSIDIDYAIESAMENMYEDFNDIEDEKGLQEFVKEWNAKQTGKSYETDYSTVVLLNE